MTTMTRERFNQALKYGYIEVVFDENKNGLVEIQNTKTKKHHVLYITD